MALTDKQIVFVTGASRSGTTLMSFVLRNHSSVFGLREMHYFGDVWDPRDKDQHYSDDKAVSCIAAMLARQEQGVLATAPEEEHLREAKDVIARLNSQQLSAAEIYVAAVNDISAGSGKAIVCEQTPKNIFYAQALLDTYPNAKVVHMARDPRAIMASQKKRWKRRELSTDNSRFPLRQSLRVWVNYHPYTISRLWNQATKTACRLQGHPRFKIVSFESLLTEPEQTIRGLCEFLEIPFEESMLDVGQVNSSHQSSVGGARRGIHKDALETWSQVLSPAEISITDRKCAQGMASLGYQPVAQAPVPEIKQQFSYIFHVLGVLLVNPRRAWVQFKALGSKGRGRSASRAKSDQVEP